MLLTQVKELINAFKIVKRKSQPYSFKGSSKKSPSELFKGKALRNSKGQRSFRIHRLSVLVENNEISAVNMTGKISRLD